MNDEEHVNMETANLQGNDDSRIIKFSCILSPNFF